MTWTKQIRTIVMLTLVICMTAVDLSVAKPKSKKDKQVPSGTAVFWRRPVDIRQRDLFLGPGGSSMQPDLSRIEFIKEEKGGYSKKFRVRDAAGREWVAKIGKEAQSETSAVRLLWAVGYPTEINYLVPRVTIPGKGTFTNVRFEARPDDVKRVEEWKWSRNPFVQTREFQGLKIMMALINNWDIKDSNNEILYVRGPEGNELRYIISDLGATFGHASGTFFFWRITRSRNNPRNYAKSEFLKKVDGNRVVLKYGGKNKGLFKNIAVEDATWIGSLLSQLSDQQIRDAFRAANYTPSEVNLLAGEVRHRTNELVNLRASERIGRR
ncbi:MAG TPA: hypothetical protein VLA93_04475 [Pyrinomonadaceae bacterium]|nr:hypothetical protein [Pyrinomonadaceae bacterium]